MQSQRATGRYLTLTAPYARTTSGLGALIGAIFAVSMDAVENAAEGVWDTEGKHELTKVGSQAWTEGQKIYWDDGNKRCTSVATAGPLIGVATAAVADGAGDVLGEVKLLGNVPGMLEGTQAALADLTFGTNIAAATANGALTDSSGTNPTEAQFNELAKELGTRLNAICAVLRTVGILTP